MGRLEIETCTDTSRGRCIQSKCRKGRNMTRNLKILGLALVAAFAMSAVVASSASAYLGTTEKQPSTLTGAQENTNVFTTHGGEVKCTTATYHGEQATTSASSITLTPTYTGCTAFGFINIPIHTNNCHYLFTPVTPLTNPRQATVHIICPTKPIEITAPGCEVTVESQTPTGGTITVKNIGAGATRELTIETALTGIHYTEHERAGFPNCKSETVTTTNGTFTGNAKLKAESVAGVQHGIFID